VTDELGWRRERGIAGVHVHLRDHRGHFPRAARSTQRVLQRLLNHVSDPAGGRRHQDPQRQRRDFVARDLVSNELVANLGAIPMHHAHVPLVEGEIHDGTQARTGVAELIVNGGAHASG
jgi:hypothetical protein